MFNSISYRITFNSLLSALFIIGTLTACQENDWFETNPKNNINRKGFTLSYYIDEPTSAFTKTSVPVESGENELHTLYILFFENTSGSNGYFVDAIKVNNPDGSPLNNNDNLDITFPEGSELTNKEDYKLILCGNIEYYTNFTDLEDLKEYCTGRTENDLVHTLLEISGVNAEGISKEQEQTDNSNRMVINKLPMSASLIKKADESSLIVELIRAVSRFDIINEIPDYELVSASVWNSMRTTTLTASIFNDYKTARTERYYGVTTEGKNKIIGSLYAFENYVTNPEQNDKQTTCLIIGLCKKGNRNVEYFRTNVNATPTTGHIIKRNNVYRTTILGVSSEGADNERDAYEGKEKLLHYLEINPVTVSNVPAAGGSTEVIQVRASGNWTAKLTRHGFYGNAGFNNNTSLKEIVGEGDDTFTITFDKLTVESVYPHIEVKITLDETDITKTLDVYQAPLSEGLYIWSNTSSYGVLTNTSVTQYKYYVYNLGQTLRDTNLFGPNGKIEVPGGYKFVHNTPFDKQYEFGKASIFQALNAPAVDELERIKEVMDAYDNKLLMFCARTSKSSTAKDGYLQLALDRYNQVFEQTTYAVAEVDLTPTTERFFHPDIEHPIIDYLLEKGPFTDSKINRNNITLKSYSSISAGLTNWPDSFVPIIMATKLDVTYCVFGIDPMRRLIWITDPGIFGGTSTPNKANYTAERTENIAFLQNFCAWMTNVAIQGEDFLNNFK